MTKHEAQSRRRQWKRWEAFERRQIRRLKVSVHDAFQIFNALCKQARAVGVWRKPGTLGDLEPELRIAAMVNRRASR